MTITERGKNKQLAINMLASLLTFIVGLGIRFVLTPYVVSSLGPEAYGFIGLTANILGYTGLLTIALNSMAGRFITIAYSSGDIDKANKYFASVFYSNIILASVMLLISIGCFIWLEYIINIPKELIFDVKLLFIMLTFNNVIGLIFGIWGIATFIKNRLDLSNIRGIIGNLMNTSILICLFGFCMPHIWYMGVAAIVMTSYNLITNWRFAKILTPELVIRKANYQWEKVKELLFSGVWNLLSRLGNILGQELDLVIANVCIGASAMGYFALTKNVPFLILSLFQTISGVFSPVLTGLYAEGKKQEMIVEFKKSIRIMSFFIALPLACLYIYGDYFYGLWLPSEDADKLQLLTILGTFALPYTLPLESLWSIFTITNKLKYSTLFMLVNNVIVFLIVMISMLIVKSQEVRLLILASTRSLCGLVRGFIFLPMYGAYCLGFRKGVFYRSIFQSLFCQAMCFTLCYISRLYIVADTWSKLILAGVVVTFICFVTSSIVILTKHDRELIFSKVLHRG